MPEAITGADLRARADGLKTVTEGDTRIYGRDALVSIINDIRQHLADAASTLEAHELHRRQTAESDAEPRPADNGAASGAHGTLTAAPVADAPDLPRQAEAAPDRDHGNDKAISKPSRKDRTEA